MISISRYIKGRQEAGAAETALPHPEILAGFCTGVLDHIGAYILTGEFSRFQPQLDEIKSALEQGIGEEQAELAAETVRSVLSLYSREAREHTQNTAIEMQQMVGALGQALALLSGGSDRAASRLQKIQETIQRTATIHDITALRASLSDAVQFIREESAKEQQAAERERETLETQVVRMRGLLSGNPNRRLPDRAEALRAIVDSSAAMLPGKALYAVAFVFDQLKAILQRYGPDAVDDLFLQLIRERVQPVAPAITAFRWSPAGVVGIAQKDRDLAQLRTVMAELNRAPLVYRIALGGRVAVLKASVSHLVVEATDARTGELIAELDRFTGFDGVRPL